LTGKPPGTKPRKHLASFSYAEGIKNYSGKDEWRSDVIVPKQL
jgi:hypothetical protein